MSRPKRAAAERSFAKVVQALASDEEDDPDLRSRKSSTPSRARRCLPLRTIRKSCRDLKQRRVQYERIVNHHITRLAAYPTSSDIDFGVHQKRALEESEESQQLQKQRGDPKRDAAFVLSAHELRRAADVDTSKSHAILRSTLRRLQLAPNMTDAEDASERDLLSMVPLSDTDDLLGITDVIVSDRFITHDSQQVRLLAACCLAEIFRISAPDPPVEAKSYSKIWTLFLDQLAVLASPKDDMGLSRFSLLEQLATVKVLVIFCDEENFICDVFACCYATCKPHQPAKTHQFFTDILSSLLFETDKIDRDILDAALAPLLPLLKYSSSAVAIAEKVLSDSAKRVQTPLSNLLNASVRAIRSTNLRSSPQKRGAGPRGSPSKDRSFADADADALSDHHDQFVELILAVERIAPDILIFVIPNFEDRLRSTDTPIRHGTTMVLGELFALRASLAHAYPSLFSEFLDRNRDVHDVIRKEITLAVPSLFRMYPHQSRLFNTILCDRSMDPEEPVRVAALHSIGMVSDLVGDGPLQRVIDRLLDKRPKVRMEALSTAVKVSWALPGRSIKKLLEDHRPFSEMEGVMSDSPDPGFDQDVENDLKLIQSRLLRIRNFPSVLVNAYSLLLRLQERATAIEVEKVIFGSFGVAVKSDEVEMLDLKLRVQRFLLFLSLLNDSTLLSYLQTAVSFRNKARRLVMKISKLRLTAKRELPPSTKGDGSGELSIAESADLRQPQPLSRGNIEEARDLAKNLAPYFSDPSEREWHEHCVALAAWHDLNVYRGLLKVLTPNCPWKESIETGRDVVARLGSKSKLGVFVAEQLLPVCSPSVFSAYFVEEVSSIAVSEACSPRSRRYLKKEDKTEEEAARTSPDILLGCLRYFFLVGQIPEALGYASDSLRKLLMLKVTYENCGAEILLAALRLASLIPEKQKVILAKVDFEKILEEHVCSKQPIRAEHAVELAKWAVRAAISSSSEGVADPLFKKVINGLANDLDAFAGDIRTIVAPLAGLTQFAKHAPDLYKPVALKCFDFVRLLLTGAINDAIPALFFKDSSGRPVLHIDVPTLSHLRREQDARLLSPTCEDPAWFVAEVVGRAVKLLVYSLEFVGTEELGSTLVTLLQVVEQSHGDVFESGSHLTASSDGANEPWQADEETMESWRICHAYNRLCVGRALLYLAGHPKFCNNIPPDALVSTMLIAQDECAEVRLAFTERVHTGVLRKSLPLRWIVSLALVAVDPVESNVTSVRKMMELVFRRRRGTIEKTRLAGRTPSMTWLPESVVPVLLWVLANLPGVEDERKAGFPESEKCIDFMLKCLFGSKEYASVLNEYIESVSISQDATEPEDESPGASTERLKELSHIASKLLKKALQGKTWNVANRQLQLSLPSDLFRIRNRWSGTKTDVRRGKRSKATLSDKTESLKESMSFQSHKAGEDVVDAEVKDLGKQRRTPKRPRTQESKEMSEVQSQQDGEGSSLIGRSESTSSSRQLRRSGRKRFAVGAPIRMSKRVRGARTTLSVGTARGGSDVRSAAEASKTESEDGAKRPEHPQTSATDGGRTEKTGDKEGDISEEVNITYDAGDTIKAEDSQAVTERPDANMTEAADDASKDVSDTVNDVSKGETEMVMKGKGGPDVSPVEEGSSKRAEKTGRSAAFENVSRKSKSSEERDEGKRVGAARTRSRSASLRSGSESKEANMTARESVEAKASKSDDKKPVVSGEGSSSHRASRSGDGRGEVKKSRGRASRSQEQHSTKQVAEEGRKREGLRRSARNRKFE